MKPYVVKVPPPPPPQMATIAGPDQKLSQVVDQFVQQLEDDFAAPQQSRFQEYMPTCKKGVQDMEEVCADCQSGPLVH